MQYVDRKTGEVKTKQEWVEHYRRGGPWTIDPETQVAARLYLGELVVFASIKALPAYKDYLELLPKDQDAY